MINLAVSLEHNNGSFFDKDDRVNLLKNDLKKFLDFEASDNHTLQSLLNYGLNNGIITQLEYEEYLNFDEALSTATGEISNRIDTNQFFLRRMANEVQNRIELIQQNPSIPAEIKMELQSVFNNIAGFSRRENYRFYLSNLLKTISINWENIGGIQKFKSGSNIIYNVSIAGYGLAYWYENGKLIKINSLKELKNLIPKLSKVINKKIVAAQFGYVRDGD